MIELENFSKIGDKIENIPPFEYRILNLNSSSFVKKREDYYSELEKKSKINTKSTIFHEEKLKAAKSLIVLFIPYLTKNHDFNGSLSVYSQGEDYHLVARRTIDMVKKIVLEKFSDANFYSQADIGELNERFFAHVCGIGKLGMNSLIINEKYGSYGNLALILTDKEIEEKVSMVDFCIECMECKKHCPTGAISGDFTINSNRCLSYLTQEKNIDEKQASLISKMEKIWGCDICQKVCPLNKKINLISASYDIIVRLDEEEIKNISSREFKRRYSDRSFFYRGKNPIIRNMNIMYSKKG